MLIRMIIVTLLLVILPLSSANAQETACAYYSVVENEGTTVRAENCGQPKQAAGVTLQPEIIETLYFDEDDLGCVWFSREDAYLVYRDGRSAHVPLIDAGCARFEEGLSIAKLQGGRLAYIDKNLEVVLDPGFEHIGSFQEGYAKVCNGPFTYEQMGEHTRMTGGQCGLIDRSGELVMNVEYPAEEYVAFRDFRNANNHCPVPPIDDESAALCHALHHAMSEEWTSYSIEMADERWEVVYSFMNGNRERTNSIELGREKADVQWHGRHDLRRR